MTENDDQTSYFRFFLDRWRAVVGVAVAAMLIIALPAIWVTQFSSPDYSVQAIWPERLSTDAPSKLAITLHDYNEHQDLSGTATLYYGWNPDDGEVAAAFDDGEFSEIANAKIDRHGIAVLDVPPAKPLPERPEDASETSPALVLRIDAGGHERWFFRTVQHVDAPVLAVTLDRPLYQPGQTIMMRALVASATTGKPLDTKARFVVRDPKYNLVFDEEITTGPNGVAATELALADRCLQGQYNIEVSTGGQTTTKSVEVRPFRLPRFKVEVTTQSEQIEPGGTLKARVVAMYTYGEPVVDADVALEASAGGMPLIGTTGKTDSEGGLDVEIAVPQNVTAGAAIAMSATVTSVAGRAEQGSGSTSVSGRTAKVEIVPDGEAAFVHGAQRGFIITTDGRGRPLAGAEVELIIPESKGERTENVTTDARGRASFDWTLDTSVGSYVSVTVVHQGATLFRENVHVTVGSGSALKLEKSVASVGEKLKIEVEARPHSGAILLVRDGVPLGATLIAPDEGAVEIEIPANAAGFVTVALLREGSIEQQAPLWIRQKGGDAVDISLDQPEYRPGTQAKVSLAFPAPEGSGDGDVTFGLVGVDEALYALKERAGVPLYVLMRRAPTSIFTALAAFDGVEQQDGDGLAIATHRFRANLQHESSVSGYSDERTSDFDRHGRSGRLHVYAWLCLIGLLALVIQMARWTKEAASKDAFSWRRVGAQVAFGFFCGMFAFGLAATDDEMLAGGLVVWIFIVACWLVAAAVKSPGLNFGRWLLGHGLGVALLAGVAVCLSDLSRGASADFFVLQAGIALPLILAAVQWFVWSFVLMRAGHVKPGLAIGSFIGVFLIGGMGAAFLTVGMSPHQEEMMAAPLVEGRFAMKADSVMPSSPEPEAVERAKRVENKPTSVPPPPPGGAAPRVRSWFPETMVWLPQIAATGGKAEVNVELPDSITTWRLDAWANTSDGRFGQGQVKLLAIQPYFLQLDVPLEVIDGDQFEVPVTLVNRSKEELEVDFAAETEGPLTLRGSRGSSSRLGPGQRSIVWLRLDADGVGDATVTVSSSSAAGEGDAVRRTIRVEPDGRVLRNATSGIVGKGWETDVRVPPDAIENTRFGEVRLFASLIADALGGLDSMLSMPTGCFEQTSSANYPNVMVLRAMRDMKPADWPDGAEEFAKTHARATRLVRMGYQKILSFQRSDGGFALYPDRNQSDIMLTAYGILQLIWASEVTDVDPQVIERAAQWLVSQQSQDGSWAPGRSVSGSSSHDTDVGLLRSTAFVVMALAATQDAQFRGYIDRALVRIEDRMESVESANALAYVANALADAGSKKLAIKAVDQLAALATRDADLAYWADSHQTWTYGYGVYASRETTALATQALLATESQTELIQPALNWIARGRGSYGGWGSTQATVWTLRALETLRSKGNNDATLRFYFGSDQLPTIQGATSLEVTKTPQPLRQFSFVPSSDEGRFVVDSSAETAAMVQLVTEYAVDWDSRFALVDGEPFGGDVEVADRRTKRGAVTRAYVRLDNLLETDARMVIIEAPVPPGAFVPNDALDLLQKQGAIDMYEILPTHVRLYVDRVEGKQERVFAYDFIPLVRGTFSLPPLRAYPYYSPEPVTEVDAGDIRTE